MKSNHDKKDFDIIEFWILIAMIVIFCLWFSGCLHFWNDIYNGRTFESVAKSELKAKEIRDIPHNRRRVPRVIDNK